MENMFTIIIQGSSDEEIDYLIDFYKPTEKQIFGAYIFYVAQYRGQKIIISNTKSGIINATISTMLGVQHYSPNLIINQGCAIACNPNLNIGDIIIGTKSIYINDFDIQKALQEQNSNSLEWTPNEKINYSIESSPEYLKIAKTIKYGNDCKVIFGILGSGDLCPMGKDEIEYLTDLLGCDCRDTESIASFKVCQTFTRDKIAFRVITKKEDSSNKNVCLNLQKLVVKFIENAIDITECALKLPLT